MATVTIVECRIPNENPGPHNSSVESDVAFVGSHRSKALEFTLNHSDYVSAGPWCWYLYDVDLDDPKAVARNKAVMGRSNQVFISQRAAWETSLRNEAPPAPGTMAP